MTNKNLCENSKENHEIDLKGILAILEFAAQQLLIWLATRFGYFIYVSNCGWQKAGEAGCVCLYPFFPFGGSQGFDFFCFKLKTIKKVSADANQEIFQNKVL